jgi:hypothetical protein
MQLKPRHVSIVFIFLILMHNEAQWENSMDEGLTIVLKNNKMHAKLAYYPNTSRYLDHCKIS